MGAPDIIEINNEIDESINHALASQNRERFLSMMSFQPYLDAVNLALIFKSYPESIYVAGGKEWAESNRTISKENIKNPIKVLLPCIEMTDKGKVFDKKAAKEAGVVLYGRYPAYEFKYAICYVYDYLQTDGEIDEEIEEMPKEPDYFKALREDEDISIQYTDDELYLNDSFSNFDRENDEEILFLREGISNTQENVELIKAFLDHRFDIVLNYGFITTGPRAEYKKRVIKAATYTIMCRYRVDKSYQDLIFMNEVEKESTKDKIKFLEDVLTLLRSVIGTYETEKSFSLDEIMLLRSLAPAIILFTNTEKKENGRNMILTYLKKMTVTCSVKENEATFLRLLNGLYEKIKEMDDEPYDRFLEFIRGLKIYSYPIFNI